MCSFSLEQDKYFIVQQTNNQVFIAIFKFNSKTKRQDPLISFNCVQCLKLGENKSFINKQQKKAKKTSQI